MTLHDRRRGQDPYAVPDPIAGAALTRPDHPAFELGESRLTWADYDRRVAVLAGALRACGVAAGERVAVSGRLSFERLVAHAAVERAGAVLCPLPTRGPGAAGVELERTLRALAPSRLLSCDKPAGEPSCGMSAELVALNDGALSYAALMALSCEPICDVYWSLSTVCRRLVSSGTTGAPRPIELTFGQVLFSAMGSTLRLGHLPEDRWLHGLPLHHVGGLAILDRAALGVTTVRLHERFEAGRFAEELLSGEVALVSLVPTMLRDLLEVLGKAPDGDPAGAPIPASLRVVLVGGAACPPELAERARRRGLPVALTWGMSETASQVATGLPGLDTIPGAGGREGVGPALAFARVRVQDARLHVDGPIAAGSVRSGDFGALSGGRVCVTGRADAIIISGGENLSPVEIENQLRLWPGVREACVVGLPDERWGERPVALVEAEQGFEEAGAKDFCREALAGYKVPARILPIAAIPRTAIGKLARAEARRLAAELLGELEQDQGLARERRQEVGAPPISTREEQA